MNPETSKILRTNLLVLLGYAVLIQIFSAFESNGADFVVLIYMMVAVSAHVAVLFIIALVNLATKRGPAGPWFLSALLVAIVGLGTCAGGAALTQFYSRPGNLH